MISNREAILPKLFIKRKTRMEACPIQSSEIPFYVETLDSSVFEPYLWKHKWRTWCFGQRKRGFDARRPPWGRWSCNLLYDQQVKNWLHDSCYRSILES